MQCEIYTANVFDRLWQMIDSTNNRYKVKRGNDLPQSKLSESKVLEIREVVEYRDHLKAQLKKLTNKKMAKHYDVHQRTIDKVTEFVTWGHVS